MRSPAALHNPNDSEDSDGYYFSDSDSPVMGDQEAEASVPPWSELETAVQALMGLDGEGGVHDEREDCWDATESAR